MQNSYNEDTAKEIIKKFKLSEKTLRVWRTRKKIPAKYFNSAGSLEDPLTKVEKQQQEKMKELLRTGKLNLKNFCEYGELEYLKVVSFADGDINELPRSLLIKLKGAINSVKIITVKLVSEANQKGQHSEAYTENIKKLLQLPYFKPSVVLKPYNVKHSDAYALVNGRSILDYDRKQRILDSYVLLSMEMGIK
jgi:hypothetical protein